MTITALFLHSGDPVALGRLNVVVVAGRSLRASLQRLPVEVHRPARSRHQDPCDPRGPVVVMTRLELDVANHAYPPAESRRHCCGHHANANGALRAGAVKARSAAERGGGAKRRGLDGAEHSATLERVMAAIVLAERCRAYAARTGR